METNIEKEIYELRTILNKMVKRDISLTDAKVIKLSVKLDNLLNIFHHEKANRN